MTKRGEKAVAKTPFGYEDMKDDQPSISFLQAGLVINNAKMSELRCMIRNEMEKRGMMGGSSLDSKKWVDPHTGLVPALVKDMRKALGPNPTATDEWLDYAIKCLIHIERRNIVRTKDWQDKYGVPRRSASSEASTASSIKRKRSSTPMQARTEDDDEPRKKLHKFSFDAIPLVIISTSREDDSWPFEFECREICDRIVEDTDSPGFIRADFDKYKEIITVERLLKDATDEIWGWFPSTLVWRQIHSEYGFRASLMQQYKHDPESALKFEIRKAQTAPSGLASVSAKPSGGINSQGDEHNQRATEDPGSSTQATTQMTTSGPTASSDNRLALPPQSPVIQSIEKLPPSPQWWDRYNVEDRNALVDSVDLSPTRSLSPLDDKDEEDPLEVDNPESQHVDVAAMFNKIRDSSACEQFSVENIEATCTMFQHPPAKISNKDKVALAGLKQPLQIIQAFAIYIIMKMCYGDPTGCLLADEMGFGKTMTAYGWIVVNRWLILMWADIDNARKNQTGKHLSEGTEEEPQAVDAVCPSQRNWPLACPCVDTHPTRDFRPALGITLVHVPPRLILNWIGEYEKFVDPSDPHLSLRLRVVHGTAPANYELKSKEAQLLWREDLRASQYIIICTYPSWNLVNNLFSEEVSWEEEVPGFTKAGNPRKPRIVSKVESRLHPAQQIMDEFHETKNPATGAMQIFRKNATKNPECKTLFMSGTPWSQSPGELEGVFKVLETVDWPNHKRLKYACDDNLKQLVVSYKRLLLKESAIESTPSLQKEMRETTNTLAGILETIMLRRTSESQWVNGPIIELTKHNSSNIMVPFPEEHQRALTRLKDLDKEKEAELRQEWEERHPGQEYHRVLNQYFRVSYKQRAVATIPGLATLLQRNEDLDLTWSNYTKQKYLAKDNNPFLAQLSMLTKSCPKLDFIADLINRLGTMKAKVKPDDKEDYEVIEVPEKLVIVSTNPVICAIFHKALQRIFPAKTITFVHGNLKQKERQDIINAFQEDTANAADVLVGPMGILGTGYTLTRARQIVICDPDWEEWKGTQAEFRIHRYGQLNDTQAWFLWCLDVPIEKTLKLRHETRRKLKQRTERNDGDAEKWLESEKDKKKLRQQAAEALLMG